MKKPQRNFVVEYKSSRRKTDSKAPSSIWGALDLKSVARNVETTLPVQTSGAMSMSASELMKPQGQVVATPTTYLNVPIANNVSVVGPSHHEGPAISDANAPLDGDEGRGVDTNAVTELHAVGEIKRRQKPRRAPGARRPPVSQPFSDPEEIVALDLDVELDDLAQLEEENRLLKTLLAAKLRKENSWLREQLRRK